METQNINYRDFLKNELASRLRANAVYSLRAFARDLEISPSSLSLILDGHQGLSVSRAKTLATKLGLSKKDSEFFCDLVEAGHARSLIKRTLAQKRIQERLIIETKPIAFDVFSIISDWFHYAILELTYLKNFKPSISWIAKKLQIKNEEAREAIKRLETVCMIEKKHSTYKAVEDFSLSTDGIPSSAIQKFHKQILNKAIIAIDEQSVSERDFSNVTFAMNSKDLLMAKEDLKKFRREFMQKYESSQDKDVVYTLNLQLFNLTKNEETNHE